MSEHIDTRKYESMKIPGRQQTGDNGAVPVAKTQLSTQSQSPTQTKSLTQPQSPTQISLTEDFFYEVEIDVVSPAIADGSVLKAQQIEAPEKDEIRELFYQMREISRQYHSVHTDFTRFFDMKVHQDNANIFYKQAVFMKDFEDDYPEIVPFSSYFPYYQMLGYKQLRTYFTWRTQVRKGVVTDTSLSYVFLYLYELLNNIGVANPQEGLEQLLFFWNAYKNYNHSIDKYVLRWLKDYHIYYDLPQSFKDFAEEQGLTSYYPKMTDSGDGFDFFCSISRYDIRKSVFYSDETSKMISDCFSFVLEKIRQDFESAGFKFDESLFRPVKKLMVWTPFKDALFCHWLQQADRRIVISENEIYICNKNEWKFSTVITTEKGRQFIGYVMKQMESILRKSVKYKYNVKAGIDMVNPETIRVLTKAGIYIDKTVQAAVLDFYKELNKIVVKVDYDSLSRIREEAVSTQESLIVEENAGFPDSSVEKIQDSDSRGQSGPPVSFPDLAVQSAAEQKIFEDAIVTDQWEILKNNLSEYELVALRIILQGGNIKQFADDNDIMPEVLADGINEKAMDDIGDNLLDDDMEIYEDYAEGVSNITQ